MKRRKNTYTRKKLSFQSKTIGKRKKIYSPFIEAFHGLLNDVSNDDLVAVNADIPIDVLPGCSSSNATAAPSYKDKRIKLSEDWRKLEDKLLSVSQSLYQKQQAFCCNCGEEEHHIIRCCDCGPHKYYCNSCWHKQHECVWYHIPDIWNGHFFEEMKLMPIVMQRADGHASNCSTSFQRKLLVVDMKGLCHHASVWFCRCETQPETLLRLNLWPSSPVFPRVAVSIELLELQRVLCLEKQVSTEGFFNALNNRFRRTPLRKVENKRLHVTLLREAIEAYRHLIYRLEHARNICNDPSINDGSFCPACEGNERNARTYCFDANFGLVRRQAAGERSCTSHHGKRYFCDEQDVKSFVESYVDGKKMTECSNFQAGSAVRSKTKNSKLDAKGVFGACCKHEFPKLMLDLHHGERFGYGVWALQKLLQSHKPLQIYYDIACKFETHLQAKENDEILANVQFAVPVFHGYGHTASCQMKYSPRYKTGFGLTEGEAMERLWSYLRNFNKITKEMKPEHREDLLSDALIYYAGKLTSKLGISLLQRHNKANCMLEQSKSNIQLIMSVCPENVTPQSLARRAMHQQTKTSDFLLDSDEEYALNLHTHFALKIELEKAEKSETDDSVVAELSGQIAKLEVTLIRAEKRDRRNQRWKPENEAYAMALANAAEKKRREIASKIQRLVTERKFLSTLIQKYPSGQAIAQRLIGSIKRVTGGIRKLVKQYNDLESCPVVHLSQQVTLSNVINGDTFSAAEAENHSINVKALTSLEMIQRCHEEIKFVQQDITNVCTFYQRQIDKIENLKQAFSSSLHPYILTHQLRVELRLVNFLDDLKGLFNFSSRTPVLQLLLDGVGNESVISEEDEVDDVGEQLEQYEHDFLFDDLSEGDASEDDEA